MPEQYSSANSGISISNASSQGSKKFNPKDVLNGLTKDVKKRWLIVGGVVAFCLSMAGSYMADRSKPAPVKRTPTAPTVETTPKGISNQADWKVQTSAEVLALKRTLSESKATQREILARLDALNQELAQYKSNAPAKTVVPRNQIDLTLPPPPSAPKSLRPPEKPAASAERTFTRAPGPVSAQPLESPLAPVKRSPARSFIPQDRTASLGDAQGSEMIELEPNKEYRGMLPANSFVDASLISGVDAMTGGAAQSQPQPVVLRINQNAILPNSAGYSLKGCHVLASVWGDMSSERVYGRLATLTCVDASNQLVLSEEVQGVLIDSDGKNGIRGILQDRQGAKLGRALLAGFAEGMADALGNGLTTTSTSALGTTSSILGKDALKSASYGGASEAAQQLADFYLKQAEATMPVISVDAGRKVAVLFTKSQALAFQSTEAYKPKAPRKLVVERKD